jgi:hypothetical protein
MVTAGGTSTGAAAHPDGRSLRLAGCEETQRAFHHPRFDLISLLSTPAEVLTERLASRTANSYAKSPAELGRVLDDLRAIEPRLRQIANHQIPTTIPLAAVVSTLLRPAQASPAAKDSTTRSENANVTIKFGRSPASRVGGTRRHK